MVDLSRSSLVLEEKKIAWNNLRLQQSSIAQEWKRVWVNKNMAHENHRGDVAAPQVQYYGWVQTHPDRHNHSGMAGGTVKQKSGRVMRSQANRDFKGGLRPLPGFNVTVDVCSTMSWTTLLDVHMYLRASVWLHFKHRHLNHNTVHLVGNLLSRTHPSLILRRAQFPFSGVFHFLQEFQDKKTKQA